MPATFVGNSSDTHDNVDRPTLVLATLADNSSDKHGNLDLQTQPVYYMCEPR